MGMKNCKHWQESMKIGSGTVWLSGTRHEPKDRHREIPALAILLDNLWIPIAVSGELVMRGSRVEGFPPIGEVILVPWKDFGTYDQGRFVALVKLATDHIQAGKTVEIGCMGGHGRTGTFLAGLLVKLEGLKAKAAIEAVRSRYCSSALETESQEGMIFKLTREKFKKSTKPKGGSTAIDSELDFLSDTSSNSENGWWNKNKGSKAVLGAISQAKSAVKNRLMSPTEELEELGDELKRKERLDELTNKGLLTDKEWDELEALEAGDIASSVEEEWEQMGLVSQDESTLLEEIKKQYVMCETCSLLVGDGCTCCSKCGYTHVSKACAFVKCAACGNKIVKATGRHEHGHETCASIPASN